MTYDSHLMSILEYADQSRITVRHSMNRYFNDVDLTVDLKSTLSAEIMRTIPREPAT